MSHHSLNLNESVYKYMLSVSLRENPILTELRSETSKLTQAQMQISPEQGQFMQLLVELMGVRKAIEVGVFTGYSSLAIALVMPEDAKIVACDVSEEWTKVAKRYWKKASVDHKIILHLAPALQTMEELLVQGEENTFDFAFIDADKGNHLNYYEKILKLLRKGGLLLIDNVLWSGKVADQNNQEADTIAIRNLNERLKEDPRVSLSMLPVGDGLNACA